MCLIVEKSFVENPIPAMVCWKVLERGSGDYYTPYRYRLVPKDGLLKPSKLSRKQKEYSQGAKIHGGLIHAYLSNNKNHKHCFQAIALDVVAIGKYGDLVCKKLYIPELDRTITQG